MSEQWVRDGRRVQAVYVPGDGIHAEGTVIAYTDAPTVLILTDDGRRVSWRADLCHVTTDQPNRS